MNKNSFMFAILNDPSLSPKDRERVISLITRDIEKDMMSRTHQLIREELKKNGAPNGKASKGEAPGQKFWRHDPKSVSAFLNKFSSDPVLKFVLHSWDQNEFNGYSGFIEKISLRLKQDSTFRDLFFYHIGLNYTLRQFIFNNGDTEFLIPKEKIKIGLQYPAGVIQSWMDSNPEKKLGEMPMNAFPEDVRPKGPFNGCYIANMEELIEYFKHIIEFRDDDFEAMIHDIFENSDFHPIIDDSVSGISFYTYTSVVKGFLITVYDNLKSRILHGAPKTVRIFAENNEDRSFELHILHEGSFADKDIGDRKLMNGNLASWRLWKNTEDYNSLMSICDYSVESRFYSSDDASNRTLRTARIDYLYPDLYGDGPDDIPAPRVTFKDEEAKGFEYILRFYK